MNIALTTVILCRAFFIPFFKKGQCITGTNGPVMFANLQWNVCHLIRLFKLGWGKWLFWRKRWRDWATIASQKVC